MKPSFRRATVVLIAASVLFVWTQMGSAQSKDPMWGTWDLNLQKSTYTGAPAGAPPFKRVLKLEPAANGVKQTTITSTNLGAVNTSEFTTTFDGKDSPAPADSALDTNSMKRVDAHTLERTGKIKGQVIETVRYVLSPDGKTLTLTQKGRVNGIDYGSVQVFERQ